MTRLADIEAELSKLRAKRERRKTQDEQMRRRITELEQERARLAYPIEPGVRVITFTKIFAGNPTRYTYAAIRDPKYGLWWTSGTGAQRVTWKVLVDFMRRDNIATPSFTEMQSTSIRSYAEGDQ